MRRSVPALAAAAAAVLPVGSAWGAAFAVPAAARAAAPIRKVQGPPVDMRWGTVHVTIKVQGKKVVNIYAAAPTERPKSQFINEQAVPLLVQEALKAQSARIYAISGATMTSDAFAQSLQGALVAAHLAK